MSFLERAAAFVLKEIGYGSEFITRILGLAQKNIPEVEAIVSAAEQALAADDAAFSNHQSIVSPAVGASIKGGAYKVSVHFDAV